jgi:hypothetical protein
MLFAQLLLGVLTGCDRKPATTNNEAVPAVSASAAPRAAAVADAAAAPLEKVEIPEVRVRPNADTTVRVTWMMPKGTGVNDEAPFRVRWNRSDGLADAPSDVKSTGSTVKDGFKIKVRPIGPNATLDGEIDIVVCDDLTHSVCVPVRRSIQLGFISAQDAAEEATVAVPLPAAK